MSDRRLLYFTRRASNGLVSVRSFGTISKSSGVEARKACGVNLRDSPQWANVNPKSPFAVVDFLFHPRHVLGGSSRATFSTTNSGGCTMSTFHLRPDGSIVLEAGL